ncbi:hypothetical protein ABQG68_09320 [Bacillus pumilus]|uniref:hypothetical protein n=1 Tax=Bacillus TaxID=1386 RepID=UPI003315C002
MEYVPSSLEEMQKAFNILEKEGIIHDENTLLSKGKMKSYTRELINDFYKMGYEGDLSSSAKYFPDIGEIFAIFDLEVLDYQEVEKYLTNYVNKTYRGL